MTLLTFLGTGNYDEVKYYYGDKTNYFKSKFIQEALMNIFNENKMIVFVTPQAIVNKNFEELLEKFPNLKAVEIPVPKSEEEFWKLFEIIIESVGEGEEIIFDITHSFRSIPFIGFLIALFLKEVKNVKIKGVYYGAYEPNKEYAPIIDLTPMINLAEWIYAVKDLKKYGRSDSIKELLDNSRGKKLGSLLDNISKSIYYNLCGITISKAYELNSQKEKLNKILPQIKPMEYIKNDIFEFTKFGIKDFVNKSDNSIKAKLNIEILEKLFELAKYQKEKQLIPQFFQSIREWLIDMLIYEVGKDNEYFLNTWVDENTRKFIEYILYNISINKDKSKTEIIEIIENSLNNDEKENKEIEEYLKELKENNIEIKDVVSKLKNTIDNFKEEKIDIIKLLNDIRNIRNPISHAGRKKSVSYKKLDKIENLANNILKECEKILSYIKTVEK
ncbi:TIGR02221 family CRISPR-associated protein [Methanocaldococcus sp.]